MPFQRGSGTRDSRRRFARHRRPLAIPRLVPSTHYVNFAQAILYRGAGFAILWRSFAAVAGIRLIFHRCSRPFPPNRGGDLGGSRAPSRDAE
jgi:hypothetical protein